MPNKIIRDNAVVEDEWILVSEDTSALPAGDIIIPLSLWASNKDELKQREKIGIWLNSDQSPKDIAADLDQFAVIAINFPAFADGRGFSYARELRQTHQYSGELRAIGGFMRDQLQFLKRCGFNAFALNQCDLDAAMASLNDFSDHYQADITQPEPLFKRR